MAVHVVAETERIRLRRFTMDDLESLVALDGHPTVVRYVGGVATSREEFRDDYLPAYLGYYERGDAYGFWVGEDATSGDFLGWWHFRPLPDAPSDSPELGYRLVAPAWGRGLATEGSRALVDRGFREHGVHRVVASAERANVGSWRVMEKLGMRRVGEDDEEFHYALDRRDWLAGTPAGS